MAATKKKITYSEPTNYFPDSLLKKYKLGKYAETAKKGTTKAAPKKSK